MDKTVFFRSFEEEDAELIYKWMNDDDLKKMSVGVNRRICKEESIDWVRNRMRDSRDHVFWAICSVDTGKMIGYAQITDIHYINRSANFSGIVIGDKDYQDGFAWMETYLFVLEYVFERLGLHRLYGSSIVGHKQSNIAGELFLFKLEGILRDATYKNGRYYDMRISSILKNEYLENKKKGAYDYKAILKRIKQLRKKIIEL